MQDMTVLQGARLDLTVQQGDASSISATLIIKHQVTGTEITKTGTYTDGVADVSLDGLDTGEVGVYDVQVNENFTDESPLKYPDPEGCDGDCEFPTLTICESLDPEVS